MFALQKQQVTEVSNTPSGGDNSDMQSKIDSLQEENKKLQERVRKSNEESLNNIEKVRVSVIPWYNCNIAGCSIRQDEFSPCRG